MMNCNVIKTTFGISRRSLLNYQSVRFRSRNIDTRRPRNPNWGKQQILAFTYPKFTPAHPTTENLYRDCPRERELRMKAELKEANLLEQLYGDELRKFFEGSQMIAIFHRNYMCKHDKHVAWQNARRIGMELQTHNDRVAKHAIRGTKWEPILNFYQPLPNETTLLFSPTVEFKKILSYDKKSIDMFLIAVVAYGKILSKIDIQELSDMPPIEAQRGQLCSILESHQQKTISLLNRNVQELSQNLTQYVKDQQPSSE